MKFSRSVILVVAVVLISFAVSANGQASALKTHFYKKSCRQVEQIVQKIVWNQSESNPALPAKFLRLFFHDCFVKGCDASVLLDTEDAEKKAPPNLSLAGFEVIELVKSELEKVCPGVVSCADIVALAARDSVSFNFRKSLYEVETGRRDGSVSLQQEALDNLPSPVSNFSALVKSFASKGLNADDLVVLSGGHTIGTGGCFPFVSQRLYNFAGKPGAQDPSIDPTYAAFLKTQCKNVTFDLTRVEMDPNSSLTFDSNYFVALQQNKGLFISDAALLTNNRARKLVKKLSNNKNFFNAFKKSIKRMGKIGVLTGTNGEIRKKCSAVNSS